LLPSQYQFGLEQFNNEFQPLLPYTHLLMGFMEGLHQELYTKKHQASVFNAAKVVFPPTGSISNVTNIELPISTVQN